MNTLKPANTSILLDIGGSYIKSATVRKLNSSLENISRIPTPSFVNSESKFKVLPTSEFLSVVDQAIKFQLDFEPNATRLFVSGQMGGYVVESENSFEIVSWQDERVLLGENFAKYRQLSELLEESLEFKKSGSEIRPGLPLLSISTTFTNNLGINKPQKFRSVISFTTSYLTDFQNDDMHVTDAAASGFYDIFNLAWNPKLIDLVDVPLVFPKVHKEVTKIGQAEKYGIDVFSGVGDQQASLLGAGLTSMELVVNIGTGGQVAGIHVDEEGGSYQIRPYFNDQKIRTITHLPSGRSLKAFVELVCKGSATDNDYKKFIGMANQIQESAAIDISAFEKTVNELKLSRDPKEIERIPSSFFKSLIEIYTKSILDLNLEGSLIFAGGVGQKVQIISSELSTAAGREFEISDTAETTLEGLRLISESV